MLELQSTVLLGLQPKIEPRGEIRTEKKKNKDFVIIVMLFILKVKIFNLDENQTFAPKKTPKMLVRCKHQLVTPSAS